MVQLAAEWDLEVERGPDWLFVTVHPGDHLDFESPEMADQLWEVLNKHFTYRVVLDMDEVELMTSQLIGQLIMLLKRVLQHEGALRLCHLRPACQDALRLSHSNQSCRTTTPAQRPFLERSLEVCVCRGRASSTALPVAAPFASQSRVACLGRWEARSPPSAWGAAVPRPVSTSAVIQPTDWISWIRHHLASGE